MKMFALCSYVCLTLALLIALPSAIAQSNGDFFPYLGMILDNKMNVVDTYVGTPAERAGLIRGDRILSIGNTPVDKVDHAQSISLLRGRLGVPVTLTVSRGLTRFRVTLIHEALKSQDITEPKSEREQSSQFNSLDNQLVVVASKTELTGQVVESVVKGLTLLPAATKQRFITFGVTVFVTPTLEQLTDVAGSSEYDPHNKRAIICERNSDGSRTDLRRLHITTLHELGHAYDHMLNHPSRDSEFREAYASEAPRVPAQDRPILSHFLQPGNKGPSECFASLFACKYYHGNDRRLNALKADFPRCFALMQHY